MKRIGVLGGMGPQATMAFEARVHAIAQALIPPRQGRGYPPMLVLYLCHAPVLLDADDRSVKPLQADPRLFEAAVYLGGWADFLVITSNSPHAFQAEIAEAAGKPVLSMVDLAVAEVMRRGWARVGLLGVGEPGFYQRALNDLGTSWLVAPPDVRDRLDAAIFTVMEGRDDAQSRAAAAAAVAALREAGADGIVLGCTEIPLLLGEHADAPDLIDPAVLLAEAAVRLAMA